MKKAIILNVKGKIYQYTGLYLAHKEELEYINSEEAKKKIIDLYSHPENELDEDISRSLVIGLWQAKYGFHRPFSKYEYCRPYWLFKPIAWVHCFYLTLKRDCYNGLKWDL